MLLHVSVCIGGEGLQLMLGGWKLSCFNNSAHSETSSLFKLIHSHKDPDPVTVSLINLAEAYGN